MFASSPSLRTDSGGDVNEFCDSLSLLSEVSRTGAAARQMPHGISADTVRTGTLNAT